MLFWMSYENLSVLSIIFNLPSNLRLFTPPIQANEWLTLLNKMFWRVCLTKDDTLWRESYNDFFSSKYNSFTSLIKKIDYTWKAVRMRGANRCNIEYSIPCCLLEFIKKN